MRQSDHEYEERSFGDPAKLPGWKKYVFPIYMAYNGKGRKDALPMKF